MAATDVTRGRDGTNGGIGATARRLTTETKAAVKTTEFYAYIVVLAGILIAGLVTRPATATTTAFSRSRSGSTPRS